jgi:(1->4)-alpha-D-glucan 1-alpha-D-glucosylmutase
LRGGGRVCFRARPTAVADATGETASNEGPLAERDAQRTAPGPLYVVVEKILGHGERLPEEWQADGTTGYEFLNMLNGIYVDAGNRKAFDALYQAFTGLRSNFRTVVHDTKRLILRAVLASELNVLALQLNRVAASDRRFRDFTFNSLSAALIEVLACFPIYRTYINPLQGRVSERDRLYIDLAVSRARRLSPVMDPSIYDFIEHALTLSGDEDGNAAAEARDDFVLKFQQVSGPVAAKGIEDTAFYRYTRLVSLNEVGGDPDQFGVSLPAFHRLNQERQARRPYALLATSTHDTKRSEDVRARINVLSEIPGEWGAALRRWRRLNRAARQSPRNQPIPDRNDEYLLYQTLVGAWPLELLNSTDPDGYAAFCERIQAYMEKAVREAKLHTSWITQDRAYEDGLSAFVAAILASPARNRFVQDALPFMRRVADYGLTNSLSQTVLKLTVPGVPDIYQGTELWDFSLVDPDNRRPVDFVARERLLDEVAARAGDDCQERGALARDLLAARADVRIKLFLVHAALTFRSRCPELFGADGAYVPLDVHGSRAECAVAFLRRGGGHAALVVAPRFVTRLTKHGEPPLGGAWGDTAVVMKGETAGRGFRDVLSGANVTVREQGDALVLPLAEVLATLPVALLERAGE